MADEKLDVATDKDVFASAMADAPVEEKAVEPKDDRPRDESGKFIPKPDAVEEKPKADAPVEQKPAVEQKPVEDHRVPLSEHLSEREKRQAAERRAEDAERRAEQASRELQRRLAKPAESEKPIDILENPEAWAAKVQEDTDRKYFTRFVDSSMDDAKEQHGEAFDKAFGDLLKVTDGGDLSHRNRIVNSPNPGRALMKWYAEREAIREIGGDLTGYKKRLRDEAMKDPEFRKTAMEAWRVEAENGNGQRPNTVTQLPSLNRAPGSSTLAGDKEPETDAELFRSVGGGRRA